MYDNTVVSPPPLIGTQIRRLRKERGLTLSDLAQLADTSAPTMHRYESGWDRFELNTLRKIADGLGATLEVRLTPNPEPPSPVEPDPEEMVALLAPLFWDHKLRDADLERHPDWVLGRVLMFGSGAQVRAARRYYGDRAISKAIGRREIDSRTRNYWELMLEEPCIQRS
jgi:transcriptional regulator with XRE-family HTH domain